MGIAASATDDDQAALTRRGRLIGFIAIGEVGVVAALILLVALFTAIEPAFISERNLRAILRVVSFVGIIAIGQTMLLVAGEFDLSVGSVAGLSAVVSAKLMTAAALPVPVAILGGLLTGALVGLVNGTVVVRFRIPAFIQTLGMLFIGQGLIQVVTNGAPVYPLPPSVGAFGMADVVFGLGWSFVFFILAALTADFVLRRTVLGRNMYATGGNPEVARLVGIDTDLYKIGTFVLVGCSPPSPACSSWPISPAAPPRSARAGSSPSSPASSSAASASSAAPAPSPAASSACCCCRSSPAASSSSASARTGSRSPSA